MFWETVLDTIDVAIRILGHTLSSKEGKELICALGPRDAGLCLELLDRVSWYPHPIPRSLDGFTGSSESPPRRRVEDIPSHSDHTGWPAWVIS